MTEREDLESGLCCDCGAPLLGLALGTARHEPGCPATGPGYCRRLPSSVSGRKLEPFELDELERMRRGGVSQWAIDLVEAEFRKHGPNRATWSSPGLRRRSQEVLVSYVTEVLVIGSILEHHADIELDAGDGATWYPASLRRLPTDKAGGDKLFDSRIWAAAINYAPPAAELRRLILETRKWEDPEALVIVIAGEACDRPEVFTGG